MAGGASSVASAAASGAATGTQAGSAGVVERFFLLHKSGECLYQRMYTGDELDMNLVTGFFSSISTFTNSLIEQELESVELTSSRFVYRETGEFVLVALSSKNHSSSVVARGLEDVDALLTFLFGPTENWNRDFIQMEGLSDIIDTVFGQLANNLSSIAAGIEYALLQQEDREQLDRLLANLESADDVSGSMLVLEDVMMHSRMPLQEARMVMHLVRTRPMRSVSCRITPVYTHGRWYQLLVRRLPSMTLAVLVSIKASYRGLQGTIGAFETALTESGLQLPSEQPPVHVRHFATREVVAFVYHNIRTGVVLAPEQRSGPAVEKSRIMLTFAWCFKEASRIVRSSTVTDLTLFHDGYWFHYHMEGSSALYLLFSDQIKPQDISELTGEVLKRVLAKM